MSMRGRSKSWKSLTDAGQETRVMNLVTESYPKEAQKASASRTRLVTNGQSDSLNEVHGSVSSGRGSYVLT